MEEKIKNIIWISGGCGYGKTALVYSIIKKFEGKNKKTSKLEEKDFVELLMRAIKNTFSIKNIVNYFKDYDLLVLDDIDCAVMNKPKTQEVVKTMIEKITQHNKTKVILVSQKRARKMRKLKFNSNHCEYIRLKIPSTNFKIKLVKEWLRKERIVMPQDKIKEIVDKSNNLFQPRGLFLKIRSLKPYSWNSKNPARTVLAGFLFDFVLTI